LTVTSSDDDMDAEFWAWWNSLTDYDREML